MEPSAELKKALAFVVSFALVMSTATAGVAISQTPEPKTSSNASAPYAGQGAPLTTGEIDSLVSPIALYPDALVAQICAAATFPDQIAVANYWLQQNKSLTGNALMQAVDKQSWDPSVKALTQFPSVLNDLAKNLTWTSQLGDAYHSQGSEVMSAVQTLRKQAQSAGNLKTTSQQTVKTETQGGQQVIVIQPSNPQVVYIPSYNPTMIYGTPYNPPGYSTADLVTTSLLSFGAGMAVGSMMGGGCCGWGYSSWSCNWYGGGAYYHGGAYYGNNAWHGGYNNYGYHSNYNNGYQHYGSNNYNRTSYSHNTRVEGNTVNLNHSDAGAASSWNKSGLPNSAAHGWGSQDSPRKSSAFGGWGGNSGGFDGGGWGSRASSSRGWASRGGGGGWGGGGFRGGGFRR